MTNILMKRLTLSFDWRSLTILRAFFVVMVLVLAESPYVERTQGWNLSYMVCLVVVILICFGPQTDLILES